MVVDKEKLLDVLRKNREQHLKIFLEAQVGFRKAAIEELDSMLADARAGKKIRKVVHLVDPVNQTKDYDRAIGMLEMSVTKEVEISEQDFNSFVLDDWHWKGQFFASNMTYSQTALQSAGESGYQGPE